MKHHIKPAILTLTALAAVFVLGACSAAHKNIETNFFALLDKSKKEMYKFDTSRMQEKARDYVIKGSTLQQENRHADAILEFFEALHYDSSASIYYSIAKSYREMSKLDRSLEYTLKALSMDSLFTPAIELLGQIYIIQFKINDAIAAYSMLVKLQPTIDNRFMLARILEYKDIRQSIKMYEGILDEGDNFTVMMRLAELYRDTHNESKLMGLLSRMYDESPGDKRVAMSILDSYFEQENIPSALTFLGRIDNDFAQSDLDSIYEYVSSKLYLDTSAVAKQYTGQFLTRIDKRFYFNWRINLYSAYLADKIADSLLTGKFLRQTLNLTDTIADIPMQVSGFYARKNNFAAAIKVLAEFDTVFRSDVRYPLYIGIDYMQMDSNALARDYLLVALKLDSSSVDIWAQLGMIYDKLKNYDSLEICYGEALRLDPQNALVNNNYAYSLSERGVRLGEAERMINIAITAEPANSAYLDTYGWIQYQLGNYSAAAEYLMKAIDAPGAAAEVFEHMGDVYVKLGKTSQAMEYYRKAIEKDPMNKQAIEKLKSIE